MPGILIKESDIARMTAQQPENTSLARRYFKRTVMHPSTMVANSRIKKETGNIPVIGRGGLGVRPKHGMESQYTSPMPIEIDDTISAVELDEYERLNNIGKQQLLDQYTGEHFVQVRETINALCCQALRGKIDYMMKTQGGPPARYVVEYGTVSSVPIKRYLSKLTYVQAIEDLTGMVKQIRRNGIGGDVEFIAAPDVYSRYVELLAANNNLSANNKGEYLLIGAFKVRLDNDMYFDLDANGNKVEKTLCNPGEIVALAQNAGQSLLYCKLDDTVQRSATPFYSFTHERDDHRGTDLFSKSKPFPMVNVRGIVWGKYTLAQYTVNFTAGNNGTVTAEVNGNSINPGDKVSDGDTVTLTVTPADGYEIDAWSGANADDRISNDDGTFGIVVDGNKTVSVSFKSST